MKSTSISYHRCLKKDALLYLLIIPAKQKIAAGSTPRIASVHILLEHFIEFLLIADPKSRFALLADALSNIGLSVIFFSLMVDS
jgi:hypothetical protein